MGLLLQLGVIGAVWAIQYLRRPRGDAQQPQKFTVPALGDGLVQPLIYGLARVASPRLVWVGYKQAEQSEVGGGVFVYRMAMSWACGLGGGAQSHPDDDARLYRIWRDEQLVGNNHGDVTATQLNGFRVETGDIVQEGERDLINVPGQFGTGFTHFVLEPGASDQDVNDTGVGKFVEVWDGAAEAAGLTPDAAPRYRGHVVIHVYGDQQHITSEGNTVLIYSTWRGTAIGVSPDVPRFSFEIRGGRYPDGTGVPLLERIGDGDENPALVIYDILTNPWGRLGLDPALVDEASFVAAGETLAAEGHGYSRVVDQPTDALALIEDVLRQIDGVLYREPTDGTFVLKLIRDDYDVGTLPVFDADNVLELVSYSSPTWEEAYNVVRVRFEDRGKAYATRTHVESSQGLLAALGRVRALEVEFPGCKTLALARRLAARELRAYGTPLATLRIAVNRDGFTVRPGDPIVVDLPGEGITSTVFRVGEVNFGTLDDQRVILDCIQDVHGEEATADLPTFEPLPILPPYRIVERWVGEAPRWIQQRAYDTGRINDPDAARMMALAVPRGAAALQGAYRLLVSSDNGATFPPDDRGQQRFPARATVETAYGRELDPYDTGTGLRITGLSGGTLSGTADGAIILQGRNLALIDNGIAGEEEIVAFGAVTDEGGGVYTLGEVWRGLFDTVPRDHAVGARVYFLGSVDPTSGAVQNVELGRLGETGRDFDDSLAVSLVTKGDTRHQNAAPWVDDHTITLRALKPLPVADLEIGASKTPGTITEEGVDVTWKRRDRLAETVVRGDQADAEPEVGTTYTVEGTRGDGLYSAAIETLINDVEALDVSLAGLGYGAIEVSVRSVRDVTLPDGTTETLSSHQSPSLIVEAPEWRNLLLNPRGASNSEDHWTVTDGLLDAVTPGIGGAGYYLTSDHADNGSLDFYQDVNVAGWWCERMTALLWVMAKNTDSDALDTLTVDLVAKEADGTPISTQTYGPTVQHATQWFRRSVAITSLPADTAILRARILANDLGGSDWAAVAVTEMRLMVGQLVSPWVDGFESGLGSWTSVSGTFTLPTAAPLYEGAQYCKGDAAGDSEYRRDYAISGSVGYEVGATALLDFARMNDHTNGTGTVTIECRDGSGVLASATTGAENVGTTWVRRQLSVEIPIGTTTIRVRMISTRTSATASACFDDFVLTLHKHLEPDEDQTLDFTTPEPRPLPTDHDHWSRQYPAIKAPNLGLWNGSSLQGALGREPSMEASSTAYAGAKLIGCWDPELETPAVEAIDLCAGRVRTAGNTSYANFRSSDRFTVIVAGRNAELALAAARGLLGRLGTTGWSLSITAAGYAEAKLVGSSSTKTATGTQVITDGAPFVIGMSYDGTTLRVVDGDGQVTTATSGMGEIRCDEQVRFTLGRASTSETDFVGQIARVYMWREAIPHADIIEIVGDLGAVALPGGLDTYTRTGVGYYVAGADDDGAIVACAAEDRPAWGYASTADLAASSTPGLVFCGQSTNRFPTWDLTDLTVSGATVTTCDVVSPLGHLGQADSIRVTGDNADYVGHSTIPLTADAGEKVVTFFARADVAHDITVAAGSDTSGEIDAQTFSLTTTWQRFDMVVAAWDVTSAAAYVQWYPSTDGTSRTFDLAAPIGFFDTNADPGGIPAMIAPPGTSTVGTTIATDANAYTLQHQAEGEIVVVGCATTNAATSDVVNLDAGSAVDRREISLNAGAPTFTHHNAAGTGTASEVAAQDCDEPWTIRGRWCRAGLLEAASAYAGIVFDDGVAQVSDYDVTSAFTVGATELDALTLGSYANDPYNGVIRSVRITSRETRLEP